MLELAVGALLVSIVAALLGFTGIARGAAAIARLVFGIFILGAIILFVLLLLGVSLV